MNRLRTLPTASFVALLTGSPLLSSPAAAQELAELVPADAYSFMHWKHDPDAAFIDAYSQEVWDAVQEARFDELGLDFLASAGASDSDRAQAEGLLSMVGELVGGVDWQALVENEMVYAEIAGAPLPTSFPGIPSMLFASRPDPARVAELEEALANLMRAADAITDELSLESSERWHEDDPTRTYSLRIVAADHLPLVQMAVRGDRVLIGVGAQAFAEAQAILDGDSKESLVRTRRYRKAVGETPSDVSSLMYFDSRRFTRALTDQLVPYIEQNHKIPWEVKSLSAEVMDMLDTVETSVTTTRVEGLTQISECSTRYAQDAIQQQNPFYVLAAGGAAPTGELLDYVPATASAFSLTGDLDFRPLYRWALDRARTYLPQAADSMLAYEGAQALLGIDVEDDVLSWLGSETVSFSLPPTQPGSTGDSVSLTKLRDPAGARKVLERFENVYHAVVPDLLARAEQELGENGAVLPEIDIRPSKGSYPSLSTLRIKISMPGMPIPPIPPITYGVIGNLFVTTTSDEALELALATAAGEVDGLYAHPALQDGDRMPMGPVHSASLQPIGMQTREFAAGMQSAGFAIGMMSQAMGARQPEAQQAMGMAASAIRKLGLVLNRIDFLDDAVTYSEIREGGAVMYSKTTTRYVDPADR